MPVPRRPAIECFARQNGLKTCATSSGVMPGPWSTTSVPTRSPSDWPRRTKRRPRLDVLGGIRNQLGQRAAQDAAIDHHGHGRNVPFDEASTEKRGQIGEHRFDLGIERHGFREDLHPTRFYGREVKQLLNQIREVMAGPLDAFEDLESCIVVEIQPPPQQSGREPDKARERGPQLWCLCDGHGIIEEHDVHGGQATASPASSSSRLTAAARAARTRFS